MSGHHSPAGSPNELSPQSSHSGTVRLATPRPRLVRNKSDSAVQSTSSIMTLSKLYQEQKQAGGSTPSASKQPKRSPPLRGLASLTPSAQSSKKLHKRVLSTTSTHDYFQNAQQTRQEHKKPHSPPQQHTEPPAIRISPGPRLPTFQRVDAAASLAQHQTDRPGLTKQNLSSSKIYGRRMNEQKEDDKIIEDDILTGADIADEQLEDEEVDNKYKEKLSKMKEQKRAEFFNSDDGESDDVDINSDDDETHSASSKSKQSPENKESVHDATSVSSDEKEKNFNFKSLFRRMTTTASHQNNDTDSVNSEGVKKRNFLKRVALGEADEFDNLPEDNIFAKLVNMSGGGMIPGASKTANKKEDDEEAQLGENPEDIQMQPLDPEIFNAEANDIINAHRSHYANSTASSSKTRVDEDERVKHHSTQDSFLAPNPDFYLRDNNDSVYDVNIDAGDGSYIAPPERVRGGVLSSLLRLYQNPLEASRSRLHFDTESISPIPSGMTTPIHEHPAGGASIGQRLKNFTHGKKKVTIDDENLEQQQDMLNAHKRASSYSDLASLKSDGLLSPEFASKKKAGSVTNLPSFNKTQRPKLMKGASGLIKTKREQAKAKITVHIADVLQRQHFILRMCRALMLYGAPTHRLEEYLMMTARVLEIDGQFIYLPGCMIVSFGDPTTRTSEVQLVRCAQGLNLYKLHRVHRIYKEVIHDLVGVQEASTALDELINQPSTFSPWWCVFIYGFSSATVTPWAFGGGWVNLPVSFGIGLLIGFLQFIVAPKSNLYSNVFEVTASIVVAFIARGLGSISGANICFASVTQGCLALILPGWFILCGSLELQSRNLVAGSVRVFYAIIYSFLLGYGITLGAALYGWIDKNATDETTCTETLSDWWRFLFVPLFTIGLATINQARLFQMPVMLVISCVGHVVSYFASKHFSNSPQFTCAIAAFVIGVLGNLYSRVFKGIAVSAMLPAVFVQIPGGIAAKDALLSGLENANQITENATTTSSTDQALSGMAVGFSLIQVCIGITVGLFASAIVVYPFGKRSTSVFTL